MVRAMNGTAQVLAEEAESGLDRSPLYLRIRDVLAEAIASGRLPKGALLLEGPVAGLFASTRTPVRQAFALLEEAGAIRRFDGRGFLVGQGRSGPKRVALTAEMLTAYCKENLTGYKRPKYIEFRTELPKTPVGKILRRELRG